MYSFHYPNPRFTGPQPRLKGKISGFTQVVLANKAPYSFDLLIKKLNS